jgi:hypothetical protein
MMPLKYAIVMAEQDIRENAMSGGTPVRLRGLAANGNSISPTLEEVMNAIGLYTYGFVLNEGEEKDLGRMGNGIYAVMTTTRGNAAIYICGSSSQCFVSDGETNIFCDYTDGTKSIVFGRKETNGNFFIKNNLSYGHNMVIKRIVI